MLQNTSEGLKYHLVGILLVFALWLVLKSSKNALKETTLIYLLGKIDCNVRKNHGDTKLIVERKKRRSDQSGMEWNVASKSWRQDHGKRCVTRPHWKYKNMASLFFWIFFGFWVVQVEGLWLSCGKQSCCASTLGDPQLWHLRLTWTDCSWDTVLTAVAQFYFPAESWGL